MWLLRTILFVLLLAFFVTLAVQNNGTPGVNVQLFGWTFTGLPLWVVIFASALAGFVVGMAVAAIREIRLRFDTGKLRRERDELQKEIVRLRAAPLEDAISARPTEDLMR